MQLTKRLFALSVLVGAAAWADDAKKKAPPTLSSEEQDFYWKAAAGGLFEVEAAKLAIHQASNPDVKTLAAELLKDHQKASQELTAIGEAKGMSTPAHLTKEQNQSLEKLKGATGATFSGLPAGRSAVQCLSKKNTSSLLRRIRVTGIS